VHLQPTKPSDAQALPTPWLVEAGEGYSLVVTCTRRRSICYPYSQHPLQAQVPLNLSVMACQFSEDTGGPSMPVREFNLIVCPLVQSSWKTPFQTWIRTQAGESHQPVRPAGTVAFSSLDHWETLHWLRLVLGVWLRGKTMESVHCTITGPCLRTTQLNSTHLNFIMTRLQLNSWIAKYSSVT